MRYVYAVVTSALLLPTAALAALIPTLSTPLELRVSPDAPRPDSTITVSATSYAGNPNQTTYTWTVDGRVVDQGVGRDTITVDVGTVGTETTIVVSAVEDAIDRGEATITIRPAEVDIVWEGDTIVPPLSGILPLPNGGSRMTFIAVPRVVGADGVRAPDSLMYTWRVNNGQAPTKTGRGASIFTLSLPPRFGNPFTVSVEVATADGSAHAQESLAVQPAEPQILVYEAAPLLGTRFDRVVQGSFPLLDEVTFEAYPLYVARGAGASVLWSVNGAPVASVPEKPRQITLRKTGEGKGQYSIGVSYKNAAKMFEQIATSFRITF